jgi:hypothetical protein
MHASSTTRTFRYDVAFSYAGEDREYVERVARAVEGRIRIFYDRHEQIGLWGKNLYTHLSEIYGNGARFCVMFLSASYARKVWTNHERETAQARAFSDRETYLLPARFDDTTIPGLLETTAYVDLRSMTPEAFAELLVEKVHGGPAVPPPPRKPSVRWPAIAAVAVVAIAAVAVVAGIAIGAAEAGVPKTPAMWTAPETMWARQDRERPAPKPRAEQTSPRPSPVSPPDGRPGGRAEQIVRADGPGSTVRVDGSLRMRPRAVREASQQVSATAGGAVAIQGDMVLEEPLAAAP